MCGDRLFHGLKQLPGPQRARGPYLSWYSNVACECVVSPKHWCLTVSSRRLLMEVWPCFFCCDIRLTEEFLISVLLELLSEMLEFDLDESWCFVTGIPNNTLEIFSTTSEAVRSPLTTWSIPGPFQIGLEPSRASLIQKECQVWLVQGGRVWYKVVKVAQSCPTLCDQGLHSPWNSPGQNTGVGSLSQLQGIFPTQGSNPRLQHCRQIDSLPAEPQGKPTK